MKKTSLTIFFIVFFIQCHSQEGQYNLYKNEDFKFRVQIPSDWTLYGQNINNNNSMAIVDWGLPKIYSELENAEIENSISVRAYRHQKIKSVEELITSEYFRINPIETSLEIDSTNANARIVYQTKNGLNYKGKIYFLYENAIGYIVTFMATPGTYDKNINLFENFYKSIEFLK